MDAKPEASSAAGPAADTSERREDWPSRYLLQATRMIAATCDTLDNVLDANDWPTWYALPPSLAVQTRRLFLQVIRLLAWHPAALGSQPGEQDVVWDRETTREWKIGFRRNGGGSLRAIQAVCDGDSCEPPLAEDEKLATELDRVWDLGFDLACSEPGDLAVDFFLPAHREFQELLARGEVQKDQYDLFIRSWVEFNLSFIQFNADLLEEGTGSSPSDAGPPDAGPGGPRLATAACVDAATCTHGKAARCRRSR